MKPYSVGREEGDAVWVFDALDTIKADSDQTNGRFSVVEFLDFEGSSVIAIRRGITPLEPPPGPTRRLAA